MTTNNPLSGGRRVLVVDDNVDGAEMLATFLSDLGHTTAVAHDGDEALRVARQLRPEAALVDIGLPAMDGYEVARKLLEQEKGREILLVAVTGYTAEADRERALAAGFRAHVTKPIDLDAIAAMLRAVA